MAKHVLAMFKSDGTRRDFPLTKDRIIIGRKVNCDLRIPLTSVSRQHCEVLIDGDTVQVKDLGSSNGTYHNSVRVQEARLAAGDELVIGPVVFTLVVDGQPEDIKPVRTIINASEGSGEVSAAGSGGSAVKASPVATEDDIDMPGVLEEEDDSTPTIDLDDDPVAALESLSNDDSDEYDDIEFFDIDDEDDKK